MPSGDRSVELGGHDARGAKAVLDALCAAYADAYGIEPGVKTSSFRGRTEKAAARDGFSLVTAMAEGEMIGFAFGYPLAAETRWWEGLTPDPGEHWRSETGGRTFVLSEIEVRRVWQSSGVGRLLHDRLLQDRAEERATLATSPDAEVQPIYEHWGWQKVGHVPGADHDYFSAYELFVLSLKGGRDL